MSVGRWTGHIDAAYGDGAAADGDDETAAQDERLVSVTRVAVGWPEDGSDLMDLDDNLSFVYEHAPQPITFRAESDREAVLYAVCTVSSSN
jgi:hypothetical protein